MTVTIASDGREKNCAVPSAPKPKTLNDCPIRNVSAFMRCNFSRVVNDVFLLRGLHRKSWQNVQALVRTACVPLDDPVSHAELLQVGHKRPATGTPPIFGVNLLACELSLLNVVARRHDRRCTRTGHSRPSSLLASLDSHPSNAVIHDQN